ncbi:hypothetical protein ABZ760_00450 [Streptomyces sp. NPDC006658]
MAPFQGHCRSRLRRLISHGLAEEWWHVEEGRVTEQWRAASTD